MGVDIGWLSVAVERGLVPADAIAPRPTTSARQPLPPEPARVVIDVTIPGVRLASEANVRGKVGDRIARNKAVKAAVTAALPALVTPLPLPVRVVIVRIGGKRLDGDNLVRSAKAVRDVVAAYLAVDDSDPRVAWKYEQRPGYGPAVRVIVRTVPGGRA